MRKLFTKFIYPIDSANLKHEIIHSDYSFSARNSTQQFSKLCKQFHFKYIKLNNVELNASKNMRTIYNRWINSTLADNVLMRNRFAECNNTLPGDILGWVRFVEFDWIMLYVYVCCAPFFDSFLLIGIRSGATQTDSIYQRDGSERMAKN